MIGGVDKWLALEACCSYPHFLTVFDVPAHRCDDSRSRIIREGVQWKSTQMTSAIRLHRLDVTFSVCEAEGWSLGYLITIYDTCVT